MWIQRAVSSMLLSFLIWSVYQLELAVSWAVIAAAVVYVLAMALWSGLRRREQVQAKPSVQTTLWTAGWSILLSGALYGTFKLVLALFFLTHLLAFFSSWFLFFGFAAVVVVLLFALILAGMLLAMREIAEQAAIRRWYEAPLGAWMLVVKQGPRYIGRSLAALVMIWIAFPIGDAMPEGMLQPFATFLLLLIIMSWTVSGRTHRCADEKRCTATGGYRRASIHKIVGLSFIGFFILVYVALLPFFSSGMFKVALGMVSATLICLVAWIFVKLRIFAVLKWLLLLAIYPLFAGWLFYMWWVADGGPILSLLGFE